MCSVAPLLVLQRLQGPSQARGLALSESSAGVLFAYSRSLHLTKMDFMDDDDVEYIV